MSEPKYDGCIDRTDLLNKLHFDAGTYKSYMIAKTLSETERKAYKDRFEEVAKIMSYVQRMEYAQPEIIRCKECMNHGKEICYFWSHFYGTINTPDDGFCHKAERRTDEETNIS